MLNRFLFAAAAAAVTMAPDRSEPPRLKVSTWPFGRLP